MLLKNLQVMLLKNFQKVRKMCWANCWPHAKWIMMQNFVLFVQAESFQKELGSGLFYRIPVLRARCEEWWWINRIGNHWRGTGPTLLRFLILGSFRLSRFATISRSRLPLEVLTMHKSHPRLARRARWTNLTLLFFKDPLGPNLI